MLIMHGGSFFATHDSSGYCDEPQSNTEKTRRSERKTFPSFHFAVRRGAACSVAPAMINSTVYLFLKRGAARRGAAFGGAVPLTLSDER